MTDLSFIVILLGTFILGYFVARTSSKIGHTADNSTDEKYPGLKIDSFKIVFGSDFSDGHTISGNVIIQGAAYPIHLQYAVSHYSTMESIASSIQAKVNEACDNLSIPRKYMGFNLNAPERSIGISGEYVDFIGDLKGWSVSGGCNSPHVTIYTNFK